MCLPFLHKPFIFITLLSCTLFNSCQRQSDSSRSQNNQATQSEIGDFKELDKIDSSYFSVKSNPNFFPSEAEPILLSFYLRYLDSPPLDKRQRLVTNFDSQNAPYAGWALAMTRLRTSLRIEFYLKDKEGTGGWYTLSPFDDAEGNHKDNSWYAMSFLILPGNFISSLYARVNPDFSPNSVDQSYVTGVSIESFGKIESEALFQVTSGIPKSSSLRVELKELVLFKLSNVPDEIAFTRAAKGGPRTLKKLFKENCVIALDGEGEEYCEIYANKK